MERVEESIGSSVREALPTVRASCALSPTRTAMFRALFFGLGAFVGLWGMSLFAVDGVTLRLGDEALKSGLVKTFCSALPDGRRSFDPPDWISYTLVGMGGLTMLYSVALPRG